MSLNMLTLRIFGPILILTGVLGFVLPPQMALMSGTTPYNLFHIAFGVIGTALAFAGGDRTCRWFNTGFGAIDLFQAIASPLAWWPAALFEWKTADDVAHWVIGAALVGIGVMARGGHAKS